MMNNATTLVEILAAHAGGAAPETGHGFFDPKTEDYDWVSHRDFVHRVQIFAGQLCARGVENRDFCVISCASPATTLTSFYGAVAMGAVPLLLPASRSMRRMQDFFPRLNRLHRQLGERTTLVLEAEEKVQQEVMETTGLRVIPINPAAFAAGNAEGEALETWSRARPKDIAYLQQTSASTGASKLVAVTHSNIAAAVHGIRNSSDAGPREIVASWLPLHHDMGLVGCALFAFWHGYSVFLMNPFDFLKRPVRWLQTFSRYRCSMTTAPDFGYNYCTRLISEEEAQELDLASWRVAFTAAEPIRRETLLAYCRKFSSRGFPPKSFTPCYGLAEATLGVTFAKVPESPKYAVIKRMVAGLGKPVDVRRIESLRHGADPPDHDRFDTIAFSVGRAVDDVEIQLIDEDGNSITEDLCAGEIVVRGPVVTAGYLQDKDTLQAFDRGEVRTGDIGFYSDGEVYILERLKNIIIRNGENHLASVLEEQVANELQIDAGSVAVFEAELFISDSDVVAIVEIQRKAQLPEFIERLQGLPQLIDQIPLTRVLLTPRRTIPRTTSGKKRHFNCRSLLAEQRLTILHELKIESP